MWIDDDGAAHTVWMPPEDLIGSSAIDAIASIEPGAATRAADQLFDRHDEIFEAAIAAARPGPGRIDDDARMPVPPQPESFVAGDDLVASMSGFLDRVPAEWRMEVFYAFIEVLDERDAEPA